MMGKMEWRGCLMGILTSLAVSVWAVAPTGPINGDYEVTVANGETEVWSGVISGSGRLVKKGTGTLALAAANTFTGGIRIEEGFLRVDHAGALGSGKVTIVPPSTASSTVCQLCINASGTYANEIEQLADGCVLPDAGTSACQLFVTYAASPVTFTGPITSQGNFYFRPERKSGDSGSSGPGPSVKFTGDVSAPGKTILIATYGSPVFTGKVTCNFFNNVDAWSSGGAVELNNANNQINQIRVRNNVLRARTSGGLGGALLELQEGWTEGNGHGSVQLFGTTQRVKAIYEHGTAPSADISAGNRSIDSSDPATLILTGDATDRTARQSIHGKVTLLVDAKDRPSFKQTLDNRVNQTFGNLIVSNGTLAVTGAATFPNVPTVVIGPNGTFDVQSTASGALAKVSRLVVDGTLTMTRGDTLPNDGTIVLSLSSTARLTMPADTDLWVSSLTVDGTSMGPGTYTGTAYGLASGKVTVKGVPTSGDYVVSVPAGMVKTIDDLLTGDLRIVKEGPGALQITNPGNTFTGGVVINAGEVQLAGTNTFGTGTIVINSTGMTDVRLHVVGSYNKLDNDFILNGNAGEGYSSIFVKNDVKETVFTGTVTLNGHAFFRNDRLDMGSRCPAPGPTTVFEGPVLASDNYDVGIRVYGEMHFKDKVVCRNLAGVDAYSASGKVFLYSAENDIYLANVFGFFLYCMNDDVLPKFCQFATRGWGNGGSRLNLNGCNLTLKSLRSDTTDFNVLAETSASNNRFHCIYTDRGTPTLTLKGEIMSNLRRTYANIYDEVNLVIDAVENPSFVQAFDCRPSLMTGTIEVKTGGLQLEHGALFTGVPSLTIGENGFVICKNDVTNPAFPAVRTLVVNGLFDASQAAANPFLGATLDAVTIGPKGVIRLPEGTSVMAKSVTIDGQTFVNALITPEMSNGHLVGGKIAAQGGEVFNVEWTGANGDQKLSTVGNWSRSDVDLHYGSMRAVFAQSQGQATVDVPAAFAGLDFTAENGFMLGHAETPNLLSVVGDIVAEGSGAAVIDNPIHLIGSPRTLSAAAGSRLVLRSAFATEGAAPERLDVIGSGAVNVNNGVVAFEGTNVIAGAIAITTNQVVVSGLLATPGHVNQGAAVSGGAQTITIHHNSDKRVTMNILHGLCLSNAVVEKPICIRNIIGIPSLQSAVGTTNEVRGEVRFANGSWQPILIDSGSELTFAGGLVTDHSFRSRGDGTVRIVDKPVTGHGSACYNPCSGRHIFEVASNALDRLVIGYTNPRGTPIVDFRVSNVLTNGDILVGVNGGAYESPSAYTDLGNGPYTLDVNATDQLCNRLAVTPVGQITGRYPAMITVLRGRLNGDNVGFVVRGKVEGGVGFHMAGADDGVLLFTNRVFTSCGDLKVSSGVLEFARDASWLNGTNLVVTGTGTLKIGANKTFSSRFAKLDLSANGKLSIPENVVLAVAEAVRNGEKVPGGVYKTGSWNDTITGGGVLRVAEQGTFVIFR